MKALAKRLRDNHIRTEEIRSNKSALYFDKKKVNYEELNEIRKYLFTKLVATSIDALQENKNTSGTQGEVYLNKFGNILIDDSDWNGETIDYMDDTYIGTFSIKKKGAVVTESLGTNMEAMITTADIEETEDSNGLRIATDTREPIIWLRENEEIDLILYVKRSPAGEHANFYSHSKVYVAFPNDNEFALVIESRGLRTPADLFNDALSNLHKK